MSGGCGPRRAVVEDAWGEVLALDSERRLMRSFSFSSENSKVAELDREASAAFDPELTSLAPLMNWIRGTCCLVCSLWVLALAGAPPKLVLCLFKRLRLARC